jgi:hypothetical protein
MRDTTMTAPPFIPGFIALHDFEEMAVCHAIGLDPRDDPEYLAWCDAQVRQHLGLDSDAELPMPYRLYGATTMQHECAANECLHCGYHLDIDEVA